MEKYKKIIEENFNGTNDVTDVMEAHNYDTEVIYDICGDYIKYRNKILFFIDGGLYKMIERSTFNIEEQWLKFKLLTGKQAEMVIDKLDNLIYQKKYEIEKYGISKNAYDEYIEDIEDYITKINEYIESLKSL